MHVGGWGSSIINEPSSVTAFPTISAYLLSANTELLTDAGGPLTRDIFTAWVNGAHSGAQMSGGFYSLHSVPILECVLLRLVFFSSTIYCGNSDISTPT